MPAEHVDVLARGAEEVAADELVVEGLDAELAPRVLGEGGGSEEGEGETEEEVAHASLGRTSRRSGLDAREKISVDGLGDRS